MRMSHSDAARRRNASPRKPSYRATSSILRAGLARRLASGIYSLTPLAYRAIRHIEAIVREEMDAAGQELLMPVVQPVELWKESGRYEAIGSDLAQLKDRGEHAMVLGADPRGGRHRPRRDSVIESYRQLPQIVYQIQTKFRDEPRPRGGLVRTREFLMKDAYSFDASQARPRRQLRAMSRPIARSSTAAGSRAGRRGRERPRSAATPRTSSWSWPTRRGHAHRLPELRLRRQPGDRRRRARASDRHKPEPTRRYARSIRRARRPSRRSARPPDCTADQTLKSVFYAAGDELILALIRGDLEVNEVKLRNLLGTGRARAPPEEAAALGWSPATPVRSASRATAARSSSMTRVPDAGSLVAGANQRRLPPGGRDLWPRLHRREGRRHRAWRRRGCLRPLRGTLEARRGIEAANIFKLGTRTAQTMGATFWTRGRHRSRCIMGCYGLGITRLLACILEQHHDDDGIIWPRVSRRTSITCSSAGTMSGDLQAAEVALHNARRARPRSTTTAT